MNRFSRKIIEYIYCKDFLSITTLRFSRKIWTWSFVKLCKILAPMINIANDNEKILPFKVTEYNNQLWNYEFSQTYGQSDYSWQKNNNKWTNKNWKIVWIDSFRNWLLDPDIKIYCVKLNPLATQFYNSLFAKKTQKMLGLISKGNGQTFSTEFTQE